MGAMRKKKSIKTPKGDQTKTLILETALEMFQERGYEQTTMRAIAEKANVSLGNAYYYFHSKEFLIQAFYHRTHEQQLAAILPAIQNDSSLKARLLTVMRVKIETLNPYHEFAGVLFKTAANPGSPLNPFAEERRILYESPAPGRSHIEAPFMIKKLHEDFTRQANGCPEDIGLLGLRLCYWILAAAKSQD